MLTNRSTEKELLDLGPGYYSSEEFVQCQRTLFTISKLLGFYRSTLAILKNFSSSSLLDVGCGSGIFLLNISKKFPKMKLRGIDISDAAIALAEQELELKKYQNAGDVDFALQLDKSFNFPENHVDIILSTLVCHHLSDQELIEFLRNTLYSARKLVIINDLHRHILAQFFYKVLSFILFKNRLIRHDGLISIKRGFTRKEWQRLLHKADVTHYRIRWQFPFRWQVILWKK